MKRRLVLTALSCAAVLVALAALQGCAPNRIEVLDARLAQEPGPDGTRTLSHESEELIQKSPSLSSDQKRKLMALRDSIRKRLSELDVESYKLRSLLLKDTISSEDSSEEIELIKNKLKFTELKRLSVLFGAVDEAKKILGRQNVDYRQMLDEVFGGFHSHEPQ